MFKKIKLYKASSFNFTPFDDFMEGDLQFLEDYNINIVSSPKEADIIISQNLKYLKKYFWRTVFGKKFLIWTVEPRFNTSFIPIKSFLFGLIKYHIMNIYTNDIFVSNISIHCSLINKKLNLIDGNFGLISKKIIALMSYYKGLEAPALIKNGKNIDLVSLRSKIAVEGSKKGVIDVFGKGWPDNISLEDSREGNWSVRKGELMKKYNFNLCFENTAAYNYMTEKIWDSISNYCLPIYYGKYTNVYQLFPKNSFIDYSEYNSPTDLFNYIENISSDEFITRLNKCIKVYNSISEQGKVLVDIERKKTLNKIIKKVYSM